MSNEVHSGLHLEEIAARAQALKERFDLPQMKQKLLELEESMSDPSFWDNQEDAAEISKEADRLKKEIEFWRTLDQRLKDLSDLSDLALSDESFAKELGLQSAVMQKEVRELEIATLLSGKYDGANAVFAVHAGAGGTDAQDWAEMLLRMYLRYFENKHWKVDILSRSAGSEAGIKSAVLEVRGEFAYGFLKTEAGVHRLVRLSPFNPAHTRETSFALVEVLPLIPRHDIVLDPKEIKFEATTASGHGGQSVNTTYSAVRLTHIPTGITVSIQNERSQHQNKEKAMEILQSRIAKLEEEKRQAEREELRGEFRSAEWGNQIRSYVLHPYQMVKDHRTDLETSDTQSVLDGEIDQFIEAALERSI